ncbi:FAD-dependent oxidoreductase [Nonomuraea sp. NPDC051191]|uniref:FAD-dependent oxidoreductase n=1 Tax=Nonomuraea sp. NPDC051191 TaxID=3364372 RepID=UPI00379A24CE
MTETVFPQTHDVLIVGSGSVGLSAAVFLARHGVRALVVEREPGPRAHPRATGLGPRTVELLREAGLEQAVNEVAVDMSVATLGKITVDTLAAADLAAIAAGLPTRTQAFDTMTYTPARLRGVCPQNRLDRVLLDAARERGARVAYDTELLSLEQDADGVTAVVSGPDGTRTLRARYVIAADGVRSGVRATLGIGVTGPGALGPELHNVMFHADLSHLTGEYGFALAEITNPEAPGMLMAIDGATEWVFHTAQEPSPDLLRTAIGDPGLKVEIVSVLGWRARGQIADRFREGRVFLAGDAAHAVPPTGAFGLNTGVADAHNLAWKLARVLSGWSAPALLESYHDERRPVALLAMEQSLLRMRDLRMHFGHGPEAARLRAAAGAVNAPIVHLGYRYGGPSAAEGLPSTEDVTLCLDGSPGSRLPHVWIGERSTLDLVGPDFSVFTGTPVPDPGVPVHVVERWPYGTVLVRPDGFVAWRGEDDALAEAVRTCTAGA